MKLNFSHNRKRPGEDWASFGEDMKSLAIKAFPDLNEAAKERLAVSNYLSQLDPQLAFSVRQRKPKTMAECNIVASASTHHSLDYSNCSVRAHVCIPIHYTLLPPKKVKEGEKKKEKKPPKNPHKKNRQNVFT